MFNDQETGIPENLELSGAHDQGKFDYLDGDYCQSEITPGMSPHGFRHVGRSEYNYPDDDSIMLTE